LMADQPMSRVRSRRSLSRVSVRTTIVLVLVIGAGLRWLVRRAEDQRAAVRATEITGGTVEYEWDYKD